MKMAKHSRKRRWSNWIRIITNCNHWSIALTAMMNHIWKMGGYRTMIKFSMPCRWRIRCSRKPVWGSIRAPKLSMLRILTITNLKSSWRVGRRHRIRLLYQLTRRDSMRKARALELLREELRSQNIQSWTEKRASSSIHNFWAHHHQRLLSQENKIFNLKAKRYSTRRKIKDPSPKSLSHYLKRMRKLHHRRKNR